MKQFCVLAQTNTTTMLVIAIGLLAITTNVAQGHVISRKFELAGRVVNGTDVAIEDAPYQVSVRQFNKHFAGGSIISKRLILSADHVFVYPLFASMYSIQYGISDIGVSEENVIAAEKILDMKNFDISYFENDIALMVLKSDIRFSAVAQPIPLASVAPTVGASAVLTGWGFASENGGLAGTLQQATLQIMDRSICQEQYKQYTNVTENMLCAGVVGGGKDACQYDSGGPLVSNGELVGTVSFGIGCGRADRYGVYTNVAAVKSWIESNLNE